MICRNCGSEIRDDARFCPHCGAVSGAVSAPAYAGPEAPVSSSKKGLLICGAVVVIGILAAVALWASGIFSSPRETLEKALAKTVSAYATVSDAVGVPDLAPLTEQRDISQRFSLELNSINSALAGYDLSALSGLGVQMGTDLDGEARKLGISLGAFWGDDDLISCQVLADDDELYFSSPQFTGDTAYGVNTETLGADLKELTGDDSIEDVSFNLFDLLDIIIPEGRGQEWRESLQEANQALWKAVSVEKQGKETIPVNGQSVSAQALRVVIPEKALSKYVDAIEDVLSSMDYVGLYEEMLQAAGLSREEIDEVMAQLEEADIYGQLSSSLRQAVKALGDVRLDVYISGGYVSAVRYEERVQGSTVKVALELGGGKNYADDLTLDLSVDGNQVQVQSSGDHGGKNGVFTDKTTLRLSAGGMSMGKLTSDWQYDSNSGGLQWELSVDGAGSLEMNGQLTMGEDSIDLQLDNASLRVMGLELCSFAADYYVGPCQGVDLSRPALRLIGEMNMIELMTLASDLESRANAWEAGMEALFAQRLPAGLYDSLY